MGIDTMTPRLCMRSAGRTLSLAAITLLISIVSMSLAESRISRTVVSVETATSWYRDVGLFYGEAPTNLTGSAGFYRAQREADGDTPNYFASGDSIAGESYDWTQVLGWLGQSLTVYDEFPGSSAHFEAWHWHLAHNLTVDLAAYGTGDYIRAGCDWAIIKSIGPAGDYDVYGTESVTQPLTLGQTNYRKLDVGTLPWTSWGQYQGGIEGINWDVEAPVIWVDSENWECRPEPIRPADDAETSPKCGDPINVINGNVTVDATDLLLNCPGLSLLFRRSYNSVVDDTGPLGPGWTHSYNWSLSDASTAFKDATNLWKVLRTGEGREFSFLVLTNGTYQPPFDNSWRLSYADEVYSVTQPGDVALRFDTNGVLQSMADPWGNTVSLTYSNSYPDHLLTRVEHNNGQHFAFSYASGKISEIETPSDSLSTSFAYDGYGRLTNATRHLAHENQVTGYTYLSTNRFLSARSNPAGHSYSWGYEDEDAGSGERQGIRSLVGGSYFDTSITYDTNGLAVAAVRIPYGSASNRLDYYYEPSSLRIEEIRGPYDETTNTWFTSGCGLENTYDDFGNVIQRRTYCFASDQEIIETRMFDGFHNITNETIGFCTNSAEFWHYTWDTDLQVLTSVRDPEGHLTEMVYEENRLSELRNYHSQSEYYKTGYAYTTNGLLSAVTNANGNWTRYEYDAYGRLASVVPQAGPEVTFSNNVLGHVERVSMPGEAGDRLTTFDVDALGRVQSITYPDATEESFQYDAIGNLTNHVDVSGRTVRYSWVPTRKLTSTTRTLEGSPDQTVTTAIDYESRFNVLKITDPMSRIVESYALDIRDRPTNVTNVEGQAMVIEYGVGDLVNSVRRFDGTSVSNEYDSAGRLHVVILPDDTSTYTYLKIGLMQSVQSSAGLVSNVYNSANRLTASIAVGPTGRVNYTYFPAGQVSNMTSAAGSMTYSLDAAERVMQINAPEGDFEYSYNTNNGLVDVLELENGITAGYNYDVMDRLTGITWRDGQSNALRSFSYQHDTIGLITNIVREDGQEHRYAYDSLDRLVTEKRLDAAEVAGLDASYSYDLSGNRTAKNVSGVDVDYTFITNGNRMTGWSASGVGVAAFVSGSSSETIGTNEWLGQLWVSNLVAKTPIVSGTGYWTFDLSLGTGTQCIVAAIGDLAGNVAYASNQVLVTLVTNGVYEYDQAGCVTNMTFSGSDYSSSVTLQWDSQYRVTGLMTNGTLSEKYQYDALGRRTWHSDGSSTNWLVYDGIHVVAETDSDGSLLKSYTWGPGIDNLLAFTDYGDETNTYYCLTDHLGTVHALADEDGDIIESYRFDAWGRVLGVYDGNGNAISESAVGNHYLWQGRWYSWNTGLYYFRARWYDPITGRWLSKDPIGISGGLNQYVAFGNNPVNFGDPFGLLQWKGTWKNEGKQFVRDLVTYSKAHPLYDKVKSFLAREFNGYDLDNATCEGKGPGVQRVSSGGGGRLGNYDGGGIGGTVGLELSRGRAPGTSFSQLHINVQNRLMVTLFHELAHHAAETSGLGHPQWKPSDPKDVRAIDRFTRGQEKTDLPHGHYEGYYIDAILAPHL